jgi:hypothetical protein
VKQYVDSCANEPNKSAFCNCARHLHDRPQCSCFANPSGTGCFCFLNNFLSRDRLDSRCPSQAVDCQSTPDHSGCTTAMSKTIPAPSPTSADLFQPTPTSNIDAEATNNTDPTLSATSLLPPLGSDTADRTSVSVASSVHTTRVGIIAGAAVASALLVLFLAIYIWVILRRKRRLARALQHEQAILHPQVW